MPTAFKSFFLTLFLLSLLACSQNSIKKTDKNKPGLNHHSHNHTMKLQRPLSVSFKSKNSVLINSGLDSAVSLKIFLKKEKNKTLIKEVADLGSGVMTFSLPDDLTDYDYIVAVVESEGKYGNVNSAVDTYKIGEQDLINAAKRSLKNRN